MDFLTLLMITMATWRISSLLTNEGGPYQLLARLREFALKFTDALACLWCASVWIGLGFALLYAWSPGVAFWVALPFALSAGAIAWDKWNG